MCGNVLLVAVSESQPNGPNNSGSCRHRRRVLLVCHGASGQVLLCTAMDGMKPFSVKSSGTILICSLLEIVWPVHAEQAQPPAGSGAVAVERKHTRSGLNSAQNSVIKHAFDRLSHLSIFYVE